MNEMSCYGSDFTRNTKWFYIVSELLSGIIIDFQEGEKGRTEGAGLRPTTASEKAQKKEGPVGKPSPSAYSMFAPLMLSLNSRPKKAAAFRQRSILPKKISKYSVTVLTSASISSTSVTVPVSSSSANSERFTA